MHDSPWLTGIFGEHLPRLIESDAKVIQAVAGPGSGKTTGLKRRVQRLVEGNGVDPNRIFVGTFTRAIARELADELGEIISVSTIHSLALRLLRENPAALGGLRLRFLLQYEEEAMLYDIGLEQPELGINVTGAVPSIGFSLPGRNAEPCPMPGSTEQWSAGFVAAEGC